MDDIIMALRDDPGAFSTREGVLAISMPVLFAVLLALKQRGFVAKLIVVLVGLEVW